MGDGGADHEIDDEESEEADNKMDFDPEYEPPVPVRSNEVEIDEEIVSVQSKSFVSTQGWDSEMVVDYRIDENEFHKICLFDCDFFIRRPPYPDNDVYDFREVITCNVFYKLLCPGEFFQSSIEIFACRDNKLLRYSAFMIEFDTGSSYFGSYIRTC